MTLMLAMSIRRAFLLVMTLGCFFLSSSLFAEITTPLSFEEMVKTSDFICTATCVEKTTEFINGRIYTRYQFQDVDYLYKKDRASLATDGGLTLCEGGGLLKGAIPVGQYQPGMADFTVGDELLLFCKEPSAEEVAKANLSSADNTGAVSPLLTSPRIVGRSKGRYNILRHPENGEKYLVRMSTSLDTIQDRPNLSSDLRKIRQLRERAEQAKRDAKTASVAGNESSNAIEASTENIARIRRVSKEINKRADAAKEKQSELVAQDSENAGMIQDFESLNDVRARINRILEK